MSAKQWVDEAIDGYRGDSLQAILIPHDLWSEFLQAAALIATIEPNDDEFVEYRGLICRPAVGEGEIKLVTGF